MKYELLYFRQVSLDVAGYYISGCAIKAGLKTAEASKKQEIS